jgi:hypothetical protein
VLEPPHLRRALRAHRRAPPGWPSGDPASRRIKIMMTGLAADAPEFQRIARTADFACTAAAGAVGCVRGRAREGRRCHRALVRRQWREITHFRGLREDSLDGRRADRLVAFWHLRRSPLSETKRFWPQAQYGLAPPLVRQGCASTRTKTRIPDGRHCLGRRQTRSAAARRRRRGFRCPRRRDRPGDRAPATRGGCRRSSARIRCAGADATPRRGSCAPGSRRLADR